MRTEDEKRNFISAGTDDLNLMVEAGAGAGKTHLLVDRILNQIQHEVCEIQEIVAITFTRKAASEMKERLQKELVQRSEENPDSAPLKKAIENIHRMNVSTIHSFCGELIRSRPCDCDVGLEYEVLEAEDFETRLLEFERGFMAKDHVEDPELAEWISDLSLYPNLKNEFDRMLLNEELNFGVPDRKEFPRMISELQEESRVMCGHLEELLRQGADRKSFWRKGIEPAAKEVVRLFEPFQRTGSGEAFRSFFGSVDDMIRHKNSKFVNSMEDLENAMLLQKRNNEDYFPLETELLMSLVRCLRKKDEVEYAVCIWTLRAFKDYYMVKNLSGASAVSNSELLYHAMRIVEKEDARRYFQQRYRRFYIDEFQDTDPIQAKLFLALSCDNQGDLREIGMEELRLLPGRLFVVGDPKQSIYRFRGADLNVYNRVKEIFRAEETAEVIELHKTFRFHDGLGKEVSSVFRRNEVDRYGFGENSPSGIEFQELQTMRNRSWGEEFQGIFSIRSDGDFLSVVEDYLERLSQRLEEELSSEQVNELLDDYRSKLIDAVTKVFLNRCEKTIEFQESEKNGKFKKEFLERVWELLQCCWKGEKFDLTGDVDYPSLALIFDGTKQQRYCNFFTGIELLKMRMAEERTLEEEVEFFVKQFSSQGIKNGKDRHGDESKPPLLLDLNKHLISDIPEAVRRTVLWLVENQTLPVASSSGGGSAPVKFQDILILTRQKEMLANIGAALRDAGIPYYSTENRVFENYPAIRTLRLVSEFAEDYSTNRLLRLLAACFGWSPKELRMFRSAVDSEPCNAEGSGNGRSFLSFVETWRKGMQKLNSEIPDGVGRTEELERLLRILSLNGETVSDVGIEHPMALLETFLLDTKLLLCGMDPSGHEGTDNIALAYLFLRMVRDGMPITAQQVAERVRLLSRRTVERQFRPDDKADALRLMNLHKAKGLEGKIVILAGEADYSAQPGAYVNSETNKGYLIFREVRSGQGNKSKTINYENSLPEEEEICEVKNLSVTEAKEEKIRLDYVAMTRAREALILIDPVGTYDPALMKMVDLQAINPFSVSSSVEFKRSNAVPRTPLRAKKYSSGGGVSVRTPSDIEAGDISLKGTAWNRPTGAEFGTIVHRVFELMIRAKKEGRNFATEDALRLAVTDYLNENEPSVSFVNLTLMGKVSLDVLNEMEQAERIRFVFENLQKKTLSILENVWREKIFPILERSSKVYTELPFVFSVASDSELGRTFSAETVDASCPKSYLVRGKMDLVLKTEDGDYLICDFKTNIKTDEMTIEAFRSSLNEKYRHQMKLYRAAIRTIFGVSEERVRTEILDLY